MFYRFDCAVPPAAPTVDSPHHDSMQVTWLENELDVYDAAIDRYVVCWKRVTESGDDVATEGVFAFELFAFTCIR